MQGKPVYTNASGQVESLVSTHKVLRNTYLLLAITLLVSAMSAGVSMAVGLSQGAALVMMLVGFGLLFVVHKTADSSKGLVAIFAFTAVMGASIGPMLSSAHTSQCLTVLRLLCRHLAVLLWSFLVSRLTHSQRAKIFRLWVDF